MTNLKIQTVAKTPTVAKKQVLVIAVRSVNNTIQLVQTHSDSVAIASLGLEELGVSATFETGTRVQSPDGRIVYLIGAGNNELDEDNMRELAGAATRALTDFEHIIFDFPTEDLGDLQGIAEGALLGLYKYTEYKQPAKPTQVKSITLLTKVRNASSAIDSAKVLASAVSAARDEINRPANDLYPANYAALASKKAKSLGISVEILDEKQLEKQGFGGLAGVGKGSARPPRLVKLTYSPKNASKHLALVGKGITFDTGGLSLKPANSMVGMKYDMAGAATVFNSILAIAQLQLPIKVTSWMCLAENMPSGTATRPNDVIKLKNGKTVEVTNTDAEGRLVLGDGLSAASMEFPDLIVDVATLTGAARVALGNRYAGLMGSAEAVSAVEAAAFEAGELVWHMPLPVELKDMLKSDIADLQNAKIGNTAGGMLIGGLFLQEFIGFKRKSKTDKLAWAHIDIAGPANNDLGAYGYTAKGATGVIIRTLVSLAKGMAH